MKARRFEGRSPWGSSLTVVLATGLAACAASMDGSGEARGGGQAGEAPMDGEEGGAGGHSDPGSAGDGGAGGDVAGGGGTAGDPGASAGSGGGASAGSGGTSASAGIGGTSVGSGGAAASTGGMGAGTGGTSAGGMGAGAGGQAGTAPPPAPGDRTVPMFVAVGSGGRRLVSCDDGRTWIATCETEGFGSGVCKIDDTNGDHDEWSSQGIAYGEGWFVSNWGWFGRSPSAHILRSADGRRWEHVFGKPGGPQGTYGTGIAYGRGAFVIAAQRSATHRSTDAGATWVSTKFGDYPDAHRRNTLFTTWGAGRFFSFGDNGRKTTSDDGGITWVNGTMPCPYWHELAYHDGILVGSSSGGRCASSDGGVTWHRTDQQQARNDVIWNGREFYIPQGHIGVAYRSVDGRSWTTTPITGARVSNRSPERLARSPQGTMVGISADGQGFFRSTDGGTSWQIASGHPGNRIRGITWGLAAPSADCPAPAR